PAPPVTRASTPGLLSPASRASAQQRRRRRATSPEVAPPGERLPGMRTLCFDLDGTLCTNTFGDYEAAEPIAWAIDRVDALAAAGHRIVIFTARGTATGIDWGPVTRDQLERWGVTYHELRFGKPSAEIYVDDRAVSVEAWRCGDAFAAPGLTGPAPPRLSAVVELGRTYAGALLRLDAHAARAAAGARRLAGRGGRALRGRRRRRAPHRRRLRRRRRALRRRAAALPRPARRPGSRDAASARRLERGRGARPGGRGRAL